MHISLIIYDCRPGDFQRKIIWGWGELVVFGRLYGQHQAWELAEVLCELLPLS